MIFNKRILIILFAVAFVIVVGTIYFYKQTHLPKINPIDLSKYKITGIDISNHQGKIDWNKVKFWKGRKINFIYVKATEGASHVDLSYLKNIDGARANDFLVGSYHYFRTTSSPADQFKNFIKTVDKTKQDLIPLIDVEEMNNWDDKTFHANLKSFLSDVEEYFGKKPMIYCVNTFYNKHFSARYSGYKFFIGRYGNYEPFFKDKNNWTIWQFTESAIVYGIPKKVDVDLLNFRENFDELLLK